MSPIETKKDDFTADGHRLELEKARLECEKLQAEIAQVRLEWWKRPGYIGSLAPIVLAVVGFLSAFWTGYFDTRRETLENQVNNLEYQQSQLEEETTQLRDEQEALKHQNQVLVSENEQMQKKIDETYINLKVAGSDLAYTVGHLRACGPPLSDEEISKLSSVDNFGEAGVSHILNKLSSCYENLHLILPIAERDFQDYEEKLSKIPASTWAKELTPEIGPIPILRAPDGRVYHPATSKFYDSMNELERALDG